MLTQPQPHLDPAEEALCLSLICITAVIVSVHLTLRVSEIVGDLIESTEVGFTSSIFLVWASSNDKLHRDEV